MDGNGIQPQVENIGMAALGKSRYGKNSGTHMERLLFGVENAWAMCRTTHSLLKIFICFQ